MKPADSADVELDALIELFYDDSDQLGQFAQVDAQEVPLPSRDLLAHEHHMTVTVEKFHGCPVDVQVLASRDDDTHYSRKILLTRQSDGGVVQFGIVRLNMSVLAPEVQHEIRSQQTPLGRILIQHGVLRQVRLLTLCRIEAGAELAGYFGLPPGDVVYGRTALIFCDGAPAIELLEVVG